MNLPSRGKKDPACSAEVLSTKTSQDGTDFTLYGIRVYFGNTLAAEYRDITDNREKIHILCGLFNSCDIDKNHIDDIIEDFVDDLYSLS